MTDPKDTGNGMSDRSGYYDESASARQDSSLGDTHSAPSPSPRPTDANTAEGEQSSGTSFDGGNAIPR